MVIFNAIIFFDNVFGSVVELTDVQRFDSTIDRSMMKNNFYTNRLYPMN